MTEHEADWKWLKRMVTQGVSAADFHEVLQALLELKERVEELEEANLLGDVPPNRFDECRQSEEDPEPECDHRWRFGVLDRDGTFHHAPFHYPPAARYCVECGQVEEIEWVPVDE